MAWTTLTFSARPAGAFISWPHSDTLAGKFFWTYRELFGERELVELLERHRENPLIAFSSLFPHGTVPMPIVSAAQQGAPDEDAYRLRKRVKRVRYLPLAALSEYIAALGSGLTEDDLERFLARVDSTAPIVASATRARVSISRSSNTVLEGQLFTHEELWVGGRVWFFVRFDRERLDDRRARTTLEAMAASGIGKRKSAGFGSFDIDSVELSAEEPPGQSTHPNAFMNLSVWVPAADDPTDGYFALSTKFARLGGDFSMAGFVAKRPFRYIREGSVFWLDGREPRPFFGRVVDNIQVGFDTPVLQNTLCLPFYLSLGNEVRR